MLNKLMLLAIIFALVLSLGFIVACGDDDDDDDDTADDDDDDGDDDDNDDDDSGDCLYEDEFTWLYNDCGVTFVDGSGNDMSLADAIADCNTCIGECAWAYIDTDDCDGAIACINDECF